MDMVKMVVAEAPWGSEGSVELVTRSGVTSAAAGSVVVSHSTVLGVVVDAVVIIGVWSTVTFGVFSVTVVSCIVGGVDGGGVVAVCRVVAVDVVDIVDVVDVVVIVDVVDDVDDGGGGSDDPVILTDRVEDGLVPPMRGLQWRLVPHP